MHCHAGELATYLPLQVCESSKTSLWTSCLLCDEISSAGSVEEILV